jgi:Ca2+/Na+ antiporter
LGDRRGDQRRIADCGKRDDPDAVEALVGLSRLLLVVGLVLLGDRANEMVCGAGGLVVAGGISPLVVGRTIVALGTSSSDLAVTVQASWAEPATTRC